MTVVKTSAKALKTAVVSVLARHSGGPLCWDLVKLPKNKQASSFPWRTWLIWQNRRHRPLVLVWFIRPLVYSPFQPLRLVLSHRFTSRIWP